MEREVSEDRGRSVVLPPRGHRAWCLLRIVWLLRASNARAVIRPYRVGGLPLQKTAQRPGTKSGAGCCDCGSRFPALASELVQLAPDVIWLHTNPAARAAKRATKTIPIVIGVSIGLVENGLVASLARPGGNLTGLELPPSEVSGKRLELLKDAVPTISRVAVLVDPGWLGRTGVPSNIEREARALGIQLQPVEAGSLAAFDAAFAAMIHGNADALMIMKSALFAVNRQQLLALALRYRLPTMSFALPFAEAGSLLAYGADPREMCHRSAVFVHKILQGSKPADLPIERAVPQLIINLKTAKQLGITISPNVLYQAIKVIK